MENSEPPAATGRNCGVGISLVWDASIGTLAVHSVEPAGSAGRSGLVLEDDIVCEVDGINVTGQPLDIVDSLVRGKEVRFLVESISLITYQIIW